MSNYEQTGLHVKNNCQNVLKTWIKTTSYFVIYLTLALFPTGLVKNLSFIYDLQHI